MKTSFARLATFLIGIALIAVPVHAQTPSPTATPLFDEAQLTAFFEGLTTTSFTTLPTPNTGGKVGLKVGDGLVVAFPAESGLSFNAILYTDDLYLQCDQIVGVDSSIPNIILVCKALKVGSTDITITQMNSNGTLQTTPWKKITVTIAPNPAVSPTPAIPSPFTDVPSSHRHLAAITQLKYTGIIGGYPDGTFRPDTTINRAEFTKIIVGVMGKTTPTRKCFSDVMEEWFAPYVCAAKENGIIGGYPDGSFGPGKGINFAEAVKIVVLAFSGQTAADFTTSAGAAWYTPYLAYANTNSYLKLVDHLLATPSVAVTRAQVAQLIANLLP